MVSLNLKSLRSVFCDVFVQFLTAKRRETVEASASIDLVLPFPDSRRRKAEAVAVCVKAGQRPPRSGRRALIQTAPRLN
jgi:hypothetical protein